MQNNTIFSSLPINKDNVIKAISSEKIKVSAKRALEIFEDLMAAGASEKKVVQGYINENIDFDWVITSISVDKLKISYPVAPEILLEGNNTFLNKLVSLQLKGLEEELSLETMDYLARNSDCALNQTLYLYFYITSRYHNSKSRLAFSSKTIDYLLDNTKFYIEEPTNFLKKINLKTKSDYSLLAFCLMGLCNKGILYREKQDIYSNYLSWAQIEKIINSTPSEAVQKSQYSIGWSLVELMLDDRLNSLSEDSTLKIVSQFCLKTQTQKLAFMVPGICLLNEGSHDKPGQAQKRREFLNMVERMHDFDWREVVLTSEPTGPFLHNLQIGMFTREILEKIIYDRGMGKNEKYRIEFLKQELSSRILKEYDIFIQRKNLMDNINEIDISDINEGLAGQAIKSIKI